MNTTQKKIADMVTFKSERSNNFIDGCITIRSADGWSVALFVPVNGTVETVKKYDVKSIQSFTFTGHDFNMACDKLRDKSVNVCTPLKEIERLQDKINEICLLGCDAHNCEYHTVFTLYRIVGNTNGTELTAPQPTASSN